MKKLLIALIFAPFAMLAACAGASEGGYRIDRAPIDSKDVISLQAGARTFANYCMNCTPRQ